MQGNEIIGNGSNIKLRKEIYLVKCPQRFVFGDPLYFEEFKGEKLASLITDYQPPKGFDARIVLEEKAMEEYPDFMEHTMTLYMAPEKTIQNYVDSRSDEIKTGGDGYWGACHEFRHEYNGRQFLDDIIVTVVIPEFETWNSMERLAGFFFEDCSGILNL